MSILTKNTECNLEPEFVSNLQTLHQANIDSSKGFKEAAQDVKNSQLAANFLKWSQERSHQALELAELVEINDGEVNREGTWLGSLHRAYMSLKAAVSSDDDHAILAEAERGEDYIKEAYEDLLKESPGTAVNDLLQHQYASVKATHDRVRVLRDACKSC
ncbi:PA2169 family four-helix-bundle protein [Bythopirellula polymerisocia]|uniref:DUF2383 domain-containing protein n=1 Tax=Bythopirellula polymerisocia TaxID=2528003 RepID=A0A5C6CTG2_9BACT|nr:PA2169 family four-helix-bundle protein [Bythopirellula polymerisocia]TWU27688.1 hypothetical protein Pla144_24650 [Bythopirellula polymerisocia]